MTQCCNGPRACRCEPTFQRWRAGVEQHCVVGQHFQMQATRLPWALAGILLPCGGRRLGGCQRARSWGKNSEVKEHLGLGFLPGGVGMPDFYTMPQYYRAQRKNHARAFSWFRGCLVRTFWGANVGGSVVGLGKIGRGWVKQGGGPVRFGRVTFFTGATCH